MKTAVIIGIVVFMLTDAFVMWCLLRASALYEQRENRRPFSDIKSDGNKRR